MEREDIVDTLQYLYKYIYISVSGYAIDNQLKNTNEYHPIDEFYFSVLNETGITDKTVLFDHIKNLKTDVYFTKLTNLKKSAQTLLAKLGVTLDDELKYKDKDNLIEFKNHIKTYILPQILLAIDDKDYDDYIFENSSLFNKRDDNLIQLLFMSDLNESNINALKCYCEDKFVLSDKIEEYFSARNFLIDNLYDGEIILI